MVVSLQLIWVAAGFLAPAGRQPLLQRRVLLLAAKKGKEAFVPYEISGDSVPMFPLPERRDAVQARSGRAALPPARLPCAWRPSLRPWLPLAPPLALCRSPVLLLASRCSPLTTRLSLFTSRCPPLAAARRKPVRACMRHRAASEQSPVLMRPRPQPQPLPPPRQAHKKFGDKGVSPSKLAPGALDAHSPSLDLAFPGLRVLHLDPPVLTVDGKHAMWSVLCMRCACGVHAVCMRCACGVHAHAVYMHIHCTCTAHALHMHCTCRLLQRRRVRCLPRARARNRHG